MTAREMFKGYKAQGQILECSKGGYRDNTFAYRICDGKDCYIVNIISSVQDKCSYNVAKVQNGKSVAVTDVSNAILYNEYLARTKRNMQLTGKK